MIKAKDIYNLKEFKEEAQNAYDEVVSNFDMYSIDNDTARYLLDSFFHMERHSQNEILYICENMLKINVDDIYREDDPESFQWVLEEAENVTDKLCDELNEIIDIDEDDDYPAMFYMEWYEGEFGISLIIESLEEYQRNPNISQNKKTILVNLKKRLPSYKNMSIDDIIFDDGVYYIPDDPDFTSDEEYSIFSNIVKLGRKNGLTIEIGYPAFWRKR